MTFTSTLTTPATVEYSKNGSAWTTYTEPITLTNVGDKVAFRGNKPNYATSESAYSSFSCSDDCYLYGNIMSLINKTNYATNTQLTASHAFRRLFYNNAKIYIHQTKQLKLPATSLRLYCYSEMFSGCTGLTSIPALSAIGLPSYCYQEMFYGCSRLSTVRCGATGGIARNNSTTSWLHGVASKGDFYKSVKVTYSGSDTKWPKNSEDGVPSGWTASDL